MIHIDIPLYTFLFAVVMMSPLVLSELLGSLWEPRLKRAESTENMFVIGAIPLMCIGALWLTAFLLSRGRVPDWAFDIGLNVR